MTDKSEDGPDAAKGPRFDAAFREQLRALFRWRRDVRRFRTDPLPESTVESLIAAACLAPSVGNSQPWRFVIVEDADRRDAVRRTFLGCNRTALDAYDGERAQAYAKLKLAGLEEAPVHLAVFVERDPALGHGLGRRTMPETLEYSAVIAVHAFWLAARAEGIGVGWVSILDPEEIRSCLEMPPDTSLVAYLCVGYPEEEHLDPELERNRWQARVEPAAVTLHR